MAGSDWGGGGWGWGGSLCQWPLLVPHEGPHHTPAALPGPPPALPGPTEYSGTPDVTGWFYIHTYIYIVQQIFVLHRRRCPPPSPKRRGGGGGGAYGSDVVRPLSRSNYQPGRPMVAVVCSTALGCTLWGTQTQSRRTYGHTEHTHTHTHTHGHTHTHTVTLTRTPPPPHTHTVTSTLTHAHTHTLWTRKVFCGTGSFKIFFI